MANKIPRIIYNDDSNTLRRISLPHTKEKVKFAVDYLANTHVDCLVWCMMESVARGKSNEAYLYPGEGSSRDLMFGLYKKGIDYMPLLIQECHKAGLSFVASFRMNDTHVKSEPEGPLASEFWREHQDWRLWEITDGKTYYNAALDYSSPAVRNLYLSMIKEAVEKYNVDGIELDFCRSPYYFQPSQAWRKRKILTVFVSEVKEILEKICDKKGKKIFLLVRVPFGKEQLIKAGMDVKAWLDSKLFDMLVMSDLNNNYNIDIKQWLQIARRNKVFFYPSIEADPAICMKDFYNMIRNPLISSQSYNPPKTPESTVRRIRAMAQNLLSQNPDGLYMFNYPCILHEDLRENIRGKNKDKRTLKLLIEPLSQIGEKATLKGKAKQYIYWKECPISIERGRPAKYNQSIRFSLLDLDVEEKDTEIIIRFVEIAEQNPHVEVAYRQNTIVPAGMIRYVVNGSQIVEKNIRRIKKPKGRILSGFFLRRHNMVELKIPSGILLCGENMISFEMSGFPRAQDPYIFIYQLEVDVNPKQE